MVNSDTNTHENNTFEKNIETAICNEVQDITNSSCDLFDFSLDIENIPIIISNDLHSQHESLQAGTANCPLATTTLPDLEIATNYDFPIQIEEIHPTSAKLTNWNVISSHLDISHNQIFYTQPQGDQREVSVSSRTCTKQATSIPNEGIHIFIYFFIKI